jgi:heme exporter protein A
LPTLAAVNLACRRGKRRVFSGVNFRLGAGQTTWLRGRNGRGKTSLQRLASGLSVPWSFVPSNSLRNVGQSRLFIRNS